MTGRLGESCGRTYDRFSKNSLYRHRILTTIVVYGIFAAIGGIKGQLGPAFLDLQSICDVDQEKGSWILTSLYIGYTLGALANGFLYHRCNGNLLFAVSALCLAVIVAAIPWCYMYSLMVAAHAITGLLIGLIDVAGNTEMIRLWRTGGQALLVGVHVIYNVGGVISPIIIAPFLLKKRQTSADTTVVLRRTQYHPAAGVAPLVEYTNESLSFGNSTVFPNSSELILDNKNDTSFAKYINTTDVLSESRTSRIYVAYSISAVVCVVMAVLFVCLYVTEKNNSTTDKVTEEKDGSRDTKDRNTNTRNVPRKFKGIALLIMVSYGTLSNGIDFSFSTYLSSFSVEYLGWTKFDGSYITAVFCILVVFGGISGMALTKCINSILYIGVQTCLIAASLVFLVISINSNFTLGVWMSAPLLGFAKAAVFPLVLGWTNRTFIHVSGQISSVFFVGAMGGSALNLFIIASFMEKYGQIWFCYVLIFESILLFILYIFAVILTKYVQQTFSKTENLMTDKETTDS